MRQLILADIHANLPAFEAVLDAAGHWDQVVFLGDVANFGPHPGQCIDLLRQLNAVNIMGNHDFMICGGWGKRNFFDQWAREQLREDQLTFLRSLPDQVQLGDTLCIHGAYDVKEDLLPGMSAANVAQAFSRQLQPGTRRVLYGHYHYGTDVSHNGVQYHCIRPVGHHRDGDTRAGYSILDNGQLTHYRVEYDLERTIRDTERIPCLTGEMREWFLDLLRHAYNEALLGKEAAVIRRLKGEGN